jgi:hypothetical protein
MQQRRQHGKKPTKKHMKPSPGTSEAKPRTPNHSRNEVTKAQHCTTSTTRGQEHATTPGRTIPPQQKAGKSHSTGSDQRPPHTNMCVYVQRVGRSKHVPRPLPQAKLYQGTSPQKTIQGSRVVGCT